MSEGTTALLERPIAYGVIAQCLHENRAHVVSPLGRLFGARPIHPDALPWFSGALGELEVGGILNKLGPEWTVLHSVPFGKDESDIDHIAISAAGVFTINTKHHFGKRIWVSDGRILVAGQKVDHLRNSRSERITVKRMLELATHTSLPVESMLVFVGAESIAFKQRPTDVTVVTANQLLRYLRKREPMLSPDSVRTIRAAALDIRTWHPTASLALDPDNLPRFAALRKASASARIRRVLWFVAAIVAIAALVVLVDGVALGAFTPHGL